MYICIWIHNYTCSSAIFQFWRKINLITSFLFPSLYILKGREHSSAWTEVTDMYCYRHKHFPNEDEGKHCLHCQYSVETDCIVIWSLPLVCLIKSTKHQTRKEKQIPDFLPCHNRAGVISGTSWTVFSWDLKIYKRPWFPKKNQMKREVSTGRVKKTLLRRWVVFHWVTLVWSLGTWRSTNCDSCSHG